ncbi:taste receptor type 2 member 140-like [Perognathus longimembris pacificus]|uniref:taste receptor type 2 member 140-like n=1 Tax=Perognathus longimembris pacificus TaxID=214514 RepID=UPI00201847BC|nr:taste receptor type 2 member 140-like [Perognathus longimembris pacificus]
MSGVLQIMFMLALSVELLIGLLGNGFMVLVTSMDWRKSRKISPVDQILLALAISRFALLFSLLLNILMSTLCPALMVTTTMLRINSTTWTVTNHFSNWLATSLGIFYFLKIANFSNSVFLYLKWRVRKVVSGAVLVSLTLLFLNIIVIKTQAGDIWTDEYPSNATYGLSSNKSVQFPILVLYNNTVFTLIPFTVSLVTFLLLIFSLWKHHQAMQHRGRVPRDASTLAHIQALYMVVAFLLLYAVFFLSLLLHFWNFKFLHENAIVLLLEVIATAFPSGHSIVLILATRKLRGTFLPMLCTPCWGT